VAQRLAEVGPEVAVDVAPPGRDGDVFKAGRRRPRGGRLAWLARVHRALPAVCFDARITQVVVIERHRTRSTLHCPLLLAVMVVR
jgi:hypothetical protein